MKPVLANPCTLSLIVSIPLSSLSIDIKVITIKILTISLANVVFPQPAGP
jgi:hypothetical protein